MFGFFKRKNKHDPEQAPQKEEPHLEDQHDTSLDESNSEAHETPTEPSESDRSETKPDIKPEIDRLETDSSAVEEATDSPRTPDALLEPSPEPAPEPVPVSEPVPQSEPEPEPTPEPEPVIEPEPAPEPIIEPVRETAERPALQDKPVAKKGDQQGWFARIKSGLGKTRANLTDGIADLFLGKKQIDDELLEDLETQLLLADVGIEATSEIIERLEARVSRKELNNPEALYRGLQEELATMLAPVAKPLVLEKSGPGPFVILVVGVNGVGKTTTIGKLTQRFQREGKSVMLAAGDTFRAAAVEQLKVWGERNRVPVIAQHTGADSASVIYDAVAAAKARGVDVLIADTAGRLHNKSHLMEELKKVHRVMQKLDDTAPHEVMLVLDAGTGQNAISQASTFNEAVPVSGITLTKLDGTAKGGIIFALAKQLETPIRFIGVGEGIDDLRPFEASDFVHALFDRQGDDASA